MKAANGLRFRETRRPVNLAAQMRTERGWSDIIIRNVSSGGFMAQCPVPPRRGHYVEVWRGEICMIGYVVWSSGSRFGARSQAKIDIPALIARCATALPGTERRGRARSPRATPPSLQAQASRSRHLGRSLEFVALGATAAAAALFLAGAVGALLSRPIADARVGLMDANARAATAK